MLALRVGSALASPSPGRSSSSWGCQLKGQQPASQPTLIASLANDYIGYVPTRKAIEQEGGYETWAARSALPAAGTGEAMVALAAGLLRALASP